MATYAMICNNDLIEVVYDCEKAPKWPPDALGNPVIAIECVPEATRDWDYNPETGEITEPVYTEPIEPEEPVRTPTQLDNIEATQLTIMTAMAEQYEESLERELTNMEVQATIYEAILEMGGAV